MSIDIDNDAQLWKATSHKEKFGLGKTDFYDEYVIKKVWPETFAKAYNKEIDMEENMRKSDVDQTITQLENKLKDHINPSHYQGIVGNYQYIECMEFILGYKGLRAHLLGQAYKYMMRLGKKDNELQEVKKAVWYLRCLEILEREGTIIGKLGELK